MCGTAQPGITLYLLAHPVLQCAVVSVSVSVVSELDLVELEMQMHPPLGLAEEM